MDVPFVAQEKIDRKQNEKIKKKILLSQNEREKNRTEFVRS